MKKTDKAALTAAIFAAALNAVPMGAAAYDPAEEPIQDVYGPPSFFEETTDQQSQLTTNTNALTFTSTTTTPTQTSMEPLYGPPWVIWSVYPELTSTSSTTTTEPVPQPEYGPPQPVYGPPLVYGDMNGDYRVDAFDLVELRKLYSNNDYNKYYDPYADVNADGQLSVADLVALSRYLLGAAKGLGWDYTEPETTTKTTQTTAINTDEDPVASLTTHYTTVYGPPSMLNGKAD